MSYQVGDQCYTSASDALSVMASQMFGATGELSWSSAVNAAGDSIVTTYSSGAFVSISPTLQDCNLITLADSNLLVWAVVAVWAAAWALKACGYSVTNWGNPV